MKNNFVLSEDGFLYCYVIDAKIDPKENYSQPLFVDCKCQFGKVKFVFWLTENISNFKVEDNKTWPINKNQYIKVSVTNLERAQNDLEKSIKKNGYPSFSLQGKFKSNFDYRIINEEDVPEELRKEIYVDRTKQIEIARKNLLNFIKDESKWNNKSLSKLIKDAIEQNSNFIKVPAALKHHHIYEGGLLVHSYEVNFICNAIQNACEELYPGVVDKDVLNLSSWMHDIGKTETYYLDENMDPKINSEKENKINHLLRGNSIFVKLAEKHNLDSEFVEKVSHCILSHHDRIDWGSAVEPIDIEAIILAKADKISSELSKNE